MSSPLPISLHALSFRYGKSMLFDGLSVSLAEPGVYGLFGPNGSGKSTLLKLLSGLIAPHKGSITVLGHTPRQRSAEFLAQIYLLPEEFHLPRLSPKALAQTHAAFYPQFSHTHYADYLRELNVPDQRFDQMSLGQKKKATIAFALATQTPVLLMDEPTNGLDIVSRAQFKRLIERPEQRGRHIIISTHQAHDLERILSHIWFIDAGKLVLCAAMRSISQHLRMGVANNANELLPVGELLYQEPIGQQIAWLARRTTSHTEPEHIQAIDMELLYKGLSINKSDVLGALEQMT